jgi:hypothetical protein
MHRMPANKIKSASWKTRKIIFMENGKYRKAYIKNKENSADKIT